MGGLATTKKIQQKNQTHLQPAHSWAGLEWPKLNAIEINQKQKKSPQPAHEWAGSQQQKNSAKKSKPIYSLPIHGQA
jgi:hypothetical protein